MPTYQKPPTVNDDARAQDIYREAARIISDKGFDATSMGDIADAVDLTKGGLYYYIKGKKALLFAIMNFAMDLLEAEVLEPAESESDPERRLANMVAGHIRVVIQDPSAMTILVYEEENLSADHRAKILTRKDKYEELLRESIQAVLDKQGKGSQMDASVVAYSFLGMIHWVVRWFDQQSSLSKEQVVDQMTHLALHGLMSHYSGDTD
ncbi:MAG: TetR/AcrR family transcriptional regulator [Holophagales bacterium]|nr:TetR/AcrR family transcriptional regulator [Holophagales bacterium]